MLGKDLIKMIKEKKLENHDFCDTNRHCGFSKKSAKDINVWNKAQINGEGCYDTGYDWDKGKVAVLNR